MVKTLRIKALILFLTLVTGESLLIFSSLLANMSQANENTPHSPPQASPRYRDLPHYPLSLRVKTIYYRIFYGQHNVFDLLKRALFTFAIPNRGIIHVGADKGEESPYYYTLGIENVLWIEADPTAAVELRKNIKDYKGSKVAVFAASDQNGQANLYHMGASHGASSSLLKAKDFLTYYPTSVNQKSTYLVETRRLDDYFKENSAKPYNIMVMDIQGAELLALKGAPETLRNIDCIITEVSYTPLYEGNALIKDLDAFLGQHDFTRVDLISCTHYTGDALYIKNNMFYLPYLDRKPS